MKVLRLVVQVGLAIWAIYILCRATIKLGSGITTVSYEQKHFREVLYPSITFCPTYSKLGPYFDWEISPTPPQVDANGFDNVLLLAEIDKLLSFSVSQRLMIFFVLIQK